MIFIGIALVIAVGIALLISTDAGSMVGLTQAQTAQLIPLLVILIVFAGGLFTRRRKASELVGSVLLWVGIFGVAALTYAYRDELTSVAARVAGELQPGVAVVDSAAGIATFRRGIGGHFEINATVNGHTTPMIFDTGASAVVLTIADAEAAGIDTEGLSFTIPVSTANGTGRAARVRLDRMEVGGIVRERVVAFVTEDGALDMSLLGMTFLETLSRYSVTQNSLELAD
ncbi:TIGR02281 family clan AA aspartic protease [Devosia sp.]|uniref:retropepsin-like aspartic protease family protein n=1 Tax=Devosia sp. TaxID=1871048 RepID=UPI002931AFE6|nr:TIGR02281 family clan AA aspartic protease [Devosia sp.]